MKGAGSLPMQSNSKTTMTRIRDLLSRGVEELQALGTSEAQASTESMLQELLNLSRSSIYLHSEQPVQDEITKLFDTQLEQRKTRIPLAYILGKTYFWKECLAVGPGCLIPRPETEILVEIVTDLFKDPSTAFSFLDIGTGSGAITVSLLRHFVHARATLLDISQKALGYAEANLFRYDLRERSEMIVSDLFQNVDPAAKWDLIVSNPPYLSKKDWSQLQPELHYEPEMALRGGEDGLDFYRRILKEARRFLRPKGWLVFEIGIGQEEALQNLLTQNGFETIQIRKDYSGIERVIQAR